MCQLGLIDFLKQSGSVVVHKQGSLSNETYQKVLEAKSAIQNYIKNTSYKVDFYDSNNMLDNINSHNHCANGVRVIVSDLLNDTSFSRDIYDNPNIEKPFIRRIYETIGLIQSDKQPIDNFIENTKLKYKCYLRKLKNKKLF